MQNYNHLEEDEEALIKSFKEAKSIVLIAAAMVSVFILIGIGLGYLMFA